MGATGSDTNVPLPWSVYTRPRVVSSLSAPRTVLREAWN